jgi:pyruvate/2-oxoglutarate dehydrogenase complex dihydrolipoamide acyltransferase (E2) component
VSEADGVITERQAEVGQVVQATMPIFSLAVDGDRDAVFNVYESLLVAPPSDAGVVVSLLDNPKVQADGFVREITPTVSAQSGTVQVKVACATCRRACNWAHRSRHHQCPGPPSIELPWSALTKALHEPAVWVVGEGDKVELRKVEVAATSPARSWSPAASKAARPWWSTAASCCTPACRCRRSTPTRG